MAKHVFKNQDNREWELLDPGEYQFKIMDVGEKFSKGKKTAGSPQLDIKIAVGDQNGIRAQWTEILVIHESTSWKTDTFLKAVGYFDDPSAYSGKEVDLTNDTLVGRRGHARIKQETYTHTGTGEERKTNRVGTWLTDKPAQPRDMDMVPKTTVVEDPDVPF